MESLPNFPSFVAGVSIVCLAVLFGGQLLNSLNGSRKRDEVGYEFTGNTVRAVATAYVLIGLWIGIRLIQTVQHPERWQEHDEMGWVFLLASVTGAILFAKGSWIARWQLALATVGLVAMTYIAVTHG